MQHPPNNSTMIGSSSTSGYNTHHSLPPLPPTQHYYGNNATANHLIPSSSTSTGGTSSHFGHTSSSHMLIPQDDSPSSGYYYNHPSYQQTSSYYQSSYPPQHTSGPMNGSSSLGNYTPVTVVSSESDEEHQNAKANQSSVLPPPLHLHSPTLRSSSSQLGQHSLYDSGVLPSPTKTSASGLYPYGGAPTNHTSTSHYGTPAHTMDGTPTSSSKSSLYENQMYNSYGTAPTSNYTYPSVTTTQSTYQHSSSAIDSSTGPSSMEDKFLSMKPSLVGLSQAPTSAFEPSSKSQQFYGTRTPSPPHLISQPGVNGSFESQQTQGDRQYSQNGTISSEPTSLAPPTEPLRNSKKLLDEMMARLKGTKESLNQMKTAESGLYSSRPTYQDYKPGRPPSPPYAPTSSQYIPPPRTSIPYGTNPDYSRDYYTNGYSTAPYYVSPYDEYQYVPPSDYYHHPPMAKPYETEESAVNLRSVSPHHHGGSWQEHPSKMKRQHPPPPSPLDKRKKPLVNQSPNAKHAKPSLPKSKKPSSGPLPSHSPTLPPPSNVINSVNNTPTKKLKTPKPPKKRLPQTNESPNSSTAVTPPNGNSVNITPKSTPTKANLNLRVRTSKQKKKQQETVRFLKGEDSDNEIMDNSADEDRDNRMKIDDDRSQESLEMDSNEQKKRDKSFISDIQMLSATADMVTKCTDYIVNELKKLPEPSDEDMKALERDVIDLSVYNCVNFTDKEKFVKPKITKRRVSKKIENSRKKNLASQVVVNETGETIRKGRLKRGPGLDVYEVICASRLQRISNEELGTDVLSKESQSNIQAAQDLQSKEHEDCEEDAAEGKKSLFYYLTNSEKDLEPHTNIHHNSILDLVQVCPSFRSQDDVYQINYQRMTLELYNLDKKMIARDVRLIEKNNRLSPTLLNELFNEEAEIQESNSPEGKRKDSQRSNGEAKKEDEDDPQKRKKRKISETSKKHNTRGSKE